MFDLPEGVVNRKEVTKDESENDADNAELLSVGDFLKASTTKRLEIVKNIHSAMDKETLAVSEVWDFVNKIEKEIHGQLLGDIGSENTSADHLENQEKIRDTLDVLARTQNYMHAPGNSVKMLLEYLAVRL